MQKSFTSFSFGCRVNQAEKEALDKQLSALGYLQDSTNPDVYVINTCSVTNKAEREARQYINQIRKKYPETKIIVTGCAATNWLKQKLEIPQVDYMVDNQSKEFIASLIAKNFKTGQLPKSAPTPRLPALEDKFLRSGRVFVKIQDGCQRFCTYCIVPYLRGLPKSIPISQLVSTLNSYPESIKEVALTAINTEAYGYDTKEGFIDLLEHLFALTKVPRISFGSIHPWSINDEFFDFYKTQMGKGRMVDFFHIPLQSGSNKMLGLMKRGYTREEFIAKLETFAQINPLAFIGTDVIVGFLEELDKDFEDTLDFLTRTPIAKFHVFRFSQRQHTAAFYLSKRLTEPTPSQKLARAKILSDLSARKYEEFQQKHIGKQFSALFLERRKDGYQQVLLSNQMPAYIRTQNDYTGEIKQVSLSAMKKGSLIGSLV